MSNYLEFKKNFIDLTHELNCEKYQMPQKIGITYSTFKKIMDYGTVPKAAILIRIADYFNVSVEYLLGRTSNFECHRIPLVPFKIRFKELREELGLSEYGVAQALNITNSYIAGWKKLNFYPSIDNLVELSKLFHVSLDYLLGRTDER